MMLSNPLSSRLSGRRTGRRASKALGSACRMESLEERQLLSLVVELRLPGTNSHTVQVTQVGQVINMEVWAVVTGSDSTGANDGLNSLNGSFLSTDQAGNGSARGTLSASPTYPFNAAGSYNGTQIDLDSDGDLDVGSSHPANVDGYYDASGAYYPDPGPGLHQETFWGVRYGGADHMKYGTASTPAQFKIGDLQFMVTDLLPGTHTEINFSPRKYGQFGALWIQDDNGTTTTALDPRKGAYIAGDPIVLTHAQAPDTQPPTASITANTLTTGGSGSYQFTVQYSDDRAVRASTIDGNDVLVTGPSGYSQFASLVGSIGGDGTPISVTYQVPPPAGGYWTSAANGMYTVSVLSGEIADTSGNTNATTTRTFSVSVPADSSGPTAAFHAASLTGGAPASPYQFTIDYADGTGVDASTFGNDDVRVTGPNGYLQFATFISSQQNGSTFTARYQVAAPSGDWASADNGTYTLALQSGSVKDVLGNGVAGSFTSFNVNVDTLEPSADITVPGAPTAGTSASTFTVTYRDNIAIDKDTAGIDGNDVIVTGPKGSSPATPTSRVNGADGKSVSVTYQFAPPGGIWDGTDNGTYTVVVQAGQVKDAVGNAVVQTSRIFRVDIPADAVAPTVSGSATNDLTVGGGPAYSFSIDYDDNIAVDPATIGDANVLVTGPNGFSQLAKRVSVATGATPTGVHAVYKVTAPGGFWDSADNGAYTVSLQADQVKDASGTPVAAQQWTFNVAVPAAIVTSGVAGVADGTLIVNRTGAPANIQLSKSGTDVVVNVNGQASTFAADSVRAVRVQDAIAGDRLTLASPLGVGTTMLQAAGQSAVLSGTTLTVNGNNLANSIRFSLSGGKISVNVDGTIDSYPSTAVKRIRVLGQGGNDRINMGNVPIGASIDGGIGNDIITGGPGRDTIHGGDGNDRIDGAAGDDQLYGDAGTDSLYGNTGNDRLDGGTGKDRLYGQAGNDVLYARDNTQDLLDGGTGTDSAKVDKVDRRSGIERLLK